VRYRLSSTLLIAALLAGATPALAGAPPSIPAIAPGYVAPVVTPAPPEVVGIAAQPFVGITLQDAIGMALLKNPNLAVSAANARIAGYQIAAAKGAYDVNFMLEPSVTHASQAPQNAFFAGPNFGAIVQNRQTLQAGVNGITPGGQQYSASVTDGRVDDNTIINAFNPYYASSLNLSLTQPLLRGLGTNPAKHQLDLAYVGADYSQAQALATASQTIASVENAYWDLVAAWRAVAIQEDALKEAQLQQGSTARRRPRRWGCARRETSA